MYKRITQCRICGNKNLVSLLNLGEQALTHLRTAMIEQHGAVTVDVQQRARLIEHRGGE